MITKELLRSWSPCSDGYKRFRELFPDGATLQVAIDGLVADGHDDWAYWLFNKCRHAGLFVEVINLGYRNSGNGNSGHRNSGHMNSGDLNSGHRNSGNGNSGNGNSGDGNSGDRNSGNWNSGHRNSGDRNSGDWNSGDGNSGYFNFDAPKKIRIFGVMCSTSLWEAAYKPAFLYFPLTEWVDASQMSDQEKLEFPFYVLTGGMLKTYGYKEAFQRSWNAADPADRIRIKDLPNFNAEIFLEISGIDLRD